MQLRHEIKYEITSHDMLVLRQRFRTIMKPDRHTEGGIYKVRSLYFENIFDKALREKLDGINKREKYRIRLYNDDPSLIRLERKHKINGLGFKETTKITPEQTRRILCGDVNWMTSAENEVLLGLYTRIRNEGLKAKVIVDYTREAFVFGPGNVRFTLDHDIRTGLSSTDLLNPDCVTVPIKDSPCILEVKYDNYLPDVVKNILQLEGRRQGAFSKYATCRMYD